jgi:broad specificity phosphatase PhoE
MNATTLYLVRHGAIVPGQEKSYIGQIDVPLGEEGVRQALALRKWLEPVRFHHVFSTDLSRARCTSNIILGSNANSIEVLPELGEISLGEWEGVSFEEIQQRFPEEFAARGRDIENWRPPGGESFADGRIRVLCALRGILDRTQGNVLLVAHAGVNRLILCEALGIPVANLHRIGQDYGCLNIIEYAPHRTRVKLVNFTPPTTRPVAETEALSDLLTLQR